MLAGHDITVMEAEDGVAALQLLQVEHFDLVITDLTMPRMTGLSLIAEIRREQTELGIIAMSGGTRKNTF
jgi:YesN/AraC family two-component response regulator